MHNDFTAQITTIYCLCDDFLRAWGHRDDPQAQMSTAEVMTVALVAAALLDGNQERSRRLLREHGYIKRVLSKSRLNRRLHAIPEAVWQALFGLLAHVHRQMNAQDADDCYAVDSLPMPACDNIRIRRCRLYPPRRTGGAFRGYCASKRRYFYGLKVHLVVTTSGLPVEVMLSPGGASDVAAFKCLSLDLAPAAYLFADAGYLDYEDEALLADAAGLSLIPQRRRNCKRQWPTWLAYIGKCERKRVETVFSRIVAALGRTVHAVTPRGFELKVFLTVLAYTITA